MSAEQYNRLETIQSDLKHAGELLDDNQIYRIPYEPTDIHVGFHPDTTVPSLHQPETPNMEVRALNEDPSTTQALCSFDLDPSIHLPPKGYELHNVLKEVNRLTGISRSELAQILDYQTSGSFSFQLSTLKSEIEKQGQTIINLVPKGQGEPRYILEILSDPVIKKVKERKRRTKSVAVDTNTQAKEVEEDKIDEPENTEVELEDDEAYILYPVQTSPTTAESSFFPNIANDKLPDPLELFHEGSQVYIYYILILEAIGKGSDSILDEANKAFLALGYKKTQLVSARGNVAAKLITDVPPPIPDKWQSKGEFVRTQGVPSSSNQGFPVFTAPDVRPVEKPREKPPNDSVLKYRIEGMLPIEKAAAEVVFNRLVGNAISETDWWEAINKAVPNRHIDLSYIQRLISDFKEDGIKIEKYKSGGMTFYYRKSYN